ncbi:MAG: helix-turn-helix transcriptional regulator [Planctomycetaceae bacterium]|nr:helix-turn-helix transcriptional regulator [Planctomycetaceae bacterium]
MSSHETVSCSSDDHQVGQSSPSDAMACRRAAAIFCALGDANRLRLLTLLMDGEKCVTEIAKALNDNNPAVSQRLRLLRTERIVTRRREGKHIYYSLDDQHISDLITNALAHAEENSERPSQ